MLRESHTAPRVLIAVALTTGLALCQLAQAETASAFNLGKRKQEPGNQQSTPAFDPTATPLEPEEAGSESTGTQNTPNKTESPAPESEMTPGTEAPPAEIPEAYTPTAAPEKPKPAPVQEPPTPDANAALRQSEKSKNAAEPAAIIQLAPPMKLTQEEISPFILNPKYANNKRDNEPEPSAAAGSSEDGEGFKREGSTEGMDDEPKKSKPLVAKELTKADRDKQIKRQDFSSKFSYILPDGWRTFQIPFQTHDVLTLRDRNKTVATINFTDELRRANLEKLRALTIESNQQDDPKYKIIDSEIESLPGGKQCAKILGTDEVDDFKARRLQYIIALSKKHHLVVTLTVGKIMGDKYDKVLHDVVASVSTEAFVTKLK